MDGKFGTLREISQTDMRDILYFVIEYPKWKTGDGAQTDTRHVYGDEVDFA